ncbi:MAG: lipocalin-like domain-containing protein [Thermoplasmatota archaeon]
MRLLLVCCLAAVLLGAGLLPVMVWPPSRQPGSVYTGASDWSASDEGAHFPCSREWWNVDAVMTLDSGARWTLTSSFEYERETPACNLFLTLFNLSSGDSYSLGSYGDPIGTLSFEKNQVNLSYGDSWMQGRYPSYRVHFERRNVTVDLQLNATTPPKWVADSISGAVLPMGLGSYRYGFIPRCTVSGTMTMDNVSHRVTGTGYYEHVWGNWTYSNPLRSGSGLEHTLKAYGQLAGWWLSHREGNPSSSIGFATESNMFGYDWIWASFDSGWSLFYGNIPFWVTEGPAFGILYLVTPDGRYLTFSDIAFSYTSMAYAPEYDAYYPTGIELEARHNEHHVALNCTMACDVNTYLDTNLSSSLWQAIYLWESPGPIAGVYSNESNTVSLNGTCEIEPMRQISVLGHNALTLDLLPPEQGLGADCSLVSHFFDVALRVRCRMLPFPRIHVAFGS